MPAEMAETMKAVAVTPGVPRSARLREVPAPEPGPGEVLVKVIQVGIDGTDAEIDEGLYGEAPPGDAYLIIGHESLGRVERISEGIEGLNPGDLVVATVRRPGGCLNCRAGESDMCLDGDYTERGIKGRHGFMAEYYSESPAFLVRVPAAFRPFAVLLEPLSIVEKAVTQSFEIQKRMRWEPKRGLVLGTGTLGLFAAVLLRLLGLEVTVVGRETHKTPSPRLDLLQTIGAQYVSSVVTPLGELPKALGNLDLIIEATGNSRVTFDAMQVLGRNGVLCLLGITGGDATVGVPADRINRETVLGNKVVFGSVNANRRYFELGIEHLGEFERRWPGFVSRFITKHLLLDSVREALAIRADHIKVVLDVAET